MLFFFFFNSLKTSLQHIQGQSLVSTLCGAFSVSNKHTTLAVEITSSTVLIMLMLTAAIGFSNFPSLKSDGVQLKIPTFNLELNLPLGLGLKSINNDDLDCLVK